MSSSAGDVGEVVVLDEQAVVQADAVVVAAAGADGVFVEQAEAGDGLARVVDLGSGALDAADEAVGEGGDAGDALEEVEDDALGGEQGAHGAADAEQRRRGAVAVAAFDDLHVEAGDQLDAEALVVGAADISTIGRPQATPTSFWHERADADGVFGDEQAAGDVVGGEVLAAGEADQLAEVFRIGEWRHRGRPPMPALYPEGKHVGGYDSKQS